MEALQFPDLLVRIKALRSASPCRLRRSAADDVVRYRPGAGSDRQTALVLVDGDAAARDAGHALAQRDATVVAAARLDEALTQAERELPHVDAILLASDLAPNVIEARGP